MNPAIATQMRRGLGTGGVASDFAPYVLDEATIHGLPPQGAKIVLCTAGSSGDVHPFIALAKELRRRGYNPVIATSNEYGAKIIAEGLKFHPVSPDLADVERELGLTNKRFIERALCPRQGLKFVVRDVTMRFLSRAYKDVMEASEGASLILTHSSAFAARLVAEVRGLPWMSVVLQPWGFLSEIDPPVMAIDPAAERIQRWIGPKICGPALAKIARRVSHPWTAKMARFRAELGLPVRTDHPIFDGQYSPFGTIAFYSPLLGQLQPDFPTATRIVGFPFYDSEDGGKPTLSPEVQAFLGAGPAPIVFSLGTAVVWTAGDFYKRSLEAVRAMGARAVFLIGENDPERLGLDVGPDIFVTRYEAHSLLFPHAQTIVHHGGIGTVAQALRAGRPQLVAPFLSDQPDNAARITRLGVGLSLPHVRYTAKRAQKALQTLAEPRFGERAAELALKVAAENGAGPAADLVEQLLRRSASATAAA